MNKRRKCFKRMDSNWNAQRDKQDKLGMLRNRNIHWVHIFCAVWQTHHKWILSLRYCCKFMKTLAELWKAVALVVEKLGQFQSPRFPPNKGWPNAGLSKDHNGDIWMTRISQWVSRHQRAANKRLIMQQCYWKQWWSEYIFYYSFLVS